MKIIKKGKIPTFTGKCRLCGCEIEAEYKEFVSERYEGIEMTTICPTKKCGLPIRLYPKRPELDKMHHQKCELAETEVNYIDYE